MDDQSTHPSSYRSFIAYGGYDEPHAPVPNLKVPFDSKGYTHTPPRREACVASILPGKEARHMRTQKGQMKMKRTRQTKVYVVADEEKPSEEGQPVTNLGHLNLVVSRVRMRVWVQTKVRPIVRARARKDGDEET